MSDLISRQAAIKALGEKPVAWSKGEYERGLQNQWGYDVSAIKQLLPAQPDVPDINVGDKDTISRAKAIDALDKRFDSIPMEQTSEILMLRKDLRELPPAQPEHIKGRWIPVGGALYQCDQCGAVSLERKFCSDCGAEMEVTT